jgi:S1-C subfamily serine protease
MADFSGGIRVRSSFSATLVKKSQNFQKLGLQFGSKPSASDPSTYVVFLAKVSGAFQKKTYLVPGLQVLSINQTVVSTPNDAIQACQSVQIGHILSVEVFGSLHKAKRTKSPLFSFGKSEKVGISIKAVTSEVTSSEIIGDAEEETQIKITHVDENGLFSGLQKGGILHAVNGKVATSFRKTLSWLTNSKTLTLIVLDPPKHPASTTDPPTSPVSPVSRSSSKKKKYATPVGLSPKTTPSPKKNKTNNNPGRKSVKTVPTTTNIYPEEDDYKLRVIACIMRPSLKTPLGLTFRQDFEDGGVIVNSVSPDGIFAKTGIHPTQKIVKINGHVCKQIALNKFDHAVDLLLQATGRVTLEAESTAVVSNKTKVRQIFSIQKAKQSLRLGLGLEAKHGVLHINNVSPTLEKVLGLKQGLQLRRVNGKSCNVNNIKSVHDQMDQAFPMLSLECISTSLATTKTTTTKKSDENVRVVACVIRPDTSIDLGLTFRQNVENGYLIVDTVASNGLFGHTGIRAKQKIVKINGHVYTRISQLKLDQAVALLQQSKGRLTVEAESVLSNPQDVVKYHIVSIQKATKSFQLGLGLQQIHTPNSTLIKINKVSPTLEKVLGLKRGLRLLRINGVPCDANNVPSVHAQMDLAFPMLSMECTLAPESYPTAVRAHPVQQGLEEKEEDDESWMAHEFAAAEKALPIVVNESGKATAKIVRTVTVELSRARLQSLSKVALDRNLGLTLAKHQHLNAIVITDISKDSLLRNQLNVGQVFVSINHISCPLTTDSTMKMLRRKAKEGPLLRIEAGDVEHVVDPNGFGHRQPSSIHLDSYVTDEETQMMEAIQIGMLKATHELKEEYDYEGPVISDEMDFEDVIQVDSIQMEGLPEALFPPKKQEVPVLPVYYEDENPDVISA